MSVREDYDWKTRAEIAERTLEFMKRELRSMHNGDGSTQLARLQSRVLARQVEMRQRETERHMAALELVLDNVSFGLLVVDARCRVMPGFSASCTELLGQAPTVGRPVTELLGLCEQAGAVYRMWVDQVVEEAFGPEVALAQLPSYFSVGARQLRVEVSAIRSEGGAIDRLLFTIADATALRSAERQARENATLVSLLQRKEAFEHFVMDCKLLCDLARTHLEQGDIPVALRHIHTIKGNAGLFGLHAVSQVCHQVEEAQPVDTAGVDAIERALVEFLDARFDILGVHYGMDAHRELQLDAAASRALEVLATRDTISGPELRQWLLRHAMPTFQQVVGPMRVSTLATAEQLGKQVEFLILGADVRVDAGHLRAVIANLPHLLRNAVDHGLEAPEDRGDKARRGRLVVGIVDQPDRYVLSVEDDGRGLDGARLAERAVRGGQLTPEAAAELSEAQRLELVYLDGVSTAEAVTAVSGRGVGMAAMRMAVLEREGQIEVQTAPGQGTRFVLSIPKAHGAEQAAA